MLPDFDGSIRLVDDGHGHAARPSTSPRWSTTASPGLPTVLANLPDDSQLNCSTPSSRCRTATCTANFTIHVHRAGAADHRRRLHRHAQDDRLPGAASTFDGALDIGPACSAAAASPNTAFAFDDDVARRNAGPVRSRSTRRTWSRSRSTLDQDTFQFHLRHRHRNRDGGAVARRGADPFPSCCSGLRGGVRKRAPHAPRHRSPDDTARDAVPKSANIALPRVRAHGRKPRTVEESINAEDRHRRRRRAPCCSRSRNAASRWREKDIEREPDRTPRHHLLLALHLSIGSLGQSHVKSLIEGPRRQPSRKRSTKSLRLDRDAGRRRRAAAEGEVLPAARRGRCAIIARRRRASLREAARRRHRSPRRASTSATSCGPGASGTRSHRRSGDGRSTIAGPRHPRRVTWTNRCANWPGGGCGSRSAASKRSRMRRHAQWMPGSCSRFSLFCWSRPPAAAAAPQEEPASSEASLTTHGAARDLRRPGELRGPVEPVRDAAQHRRRRRGHAAAGVQPARRAAQRRQGAVDARRGQRRRADDLSGEIFFRTATAIDHDSRRHRRTAAERRARTTCSSCWTTCRPARRCTSPGTRPGCSRRRQQRGHGQRAASRNRARRWRRRSRVPASGRWT